MSKNKTILKPIDHKLAEAAWYKLTPVEVARKLATDLKTGLSAPEVELRQAAYGPNELPEEKKNGYLEILLRQVRSPLVYILLFAAFISLSLAHYADLVIIGMVVVINVVVGFIQEQKATATLAELRQVVKPQAVALRAGVLQQLFSRELVPGDVIYIRAGDKAPADARVTAVHDLEVVESALTGESVPSLKTPAVLRTDTPLADQENMIFMGTEVASGSAWGVVVETGLRTQLGQIAKLLVETEEEATPLQKSLSRFSRLLVVLTLILSFLILIIGLLRRQQIFDMLPTAVAIAVAIIPEGLLISLTVILAVGMQRILRRRGLVRHLSAAETLGATSVICMDKTGTLTLGEMRVVSLVSASGELHGKDYQNKVTVSNELRNILRTALFANEAMVENPDEAAQDWKIVGNLTDKALLIAAGEVGFKKNTLDQQHKELARIPFDPRHKYTASLRELPSGQRILYVKGAAEIILRYCSFVDAGRRKIRLLPAASGILQKRLREMTGNGLRVLAVAYRPVARSVKDLSVGRSEMPGDLVFAGFVGLADPLREEVAAAIKTARTAGLRPVLITGDHKFTAFSIAAELGLEASSDKVVEGTDLDRMDDATLARRVSDTSVYARVTPAHKLRIIDAWQRMGEVVAMTGDGVNDAPALKKADIGMSLGSGTEVAKQASDLVLLDNNFGTIVAAIEQGRIIFNNIRKVILYLLSDSFSHVILVTGSLFLGLPLPLLPAQILWSNLVIDGFPNVAMTVEPGDKYIMLQKPRRKDEPFINREMKIIILFVAVISDLIFLGLFVRLLGQADFVTVRTVVFAAFGLNSLFYAFSVKNLNQPIWKINIFNNVWLVLAVLLGVVLQLFAIQWPPLQRLLHTVVIPTELWGWVAGLSLIKLAAIEIAKAFFRIQNRPLT